MTCWPDAHLHRQRQRDLGRAVDCGLASLLGVPAATRGTAWDRHDRHYRGVTARRWQPRPFRAFMHGRCPREPQTGDPALMRASLIRAQHLPTLAKIFGRRLSPDVGNAVKANGSARVASRCSASVGSAIGSEDHVQEIGDWPTVYATARESPSIGHQMPGTRR